MITRIALIPCSSEASLRSFHQAYKRGVDWLISGKQLTPYRRRRNPLAADADARQGLPAQSPAPAHDAHLVSPTRQKRRNRNQQQTRQGIALPLGTSVIRHRRQSIP